MQEKQLTQLIKQCKRHNKKAQIVLYDAYYKAMFNTAFRIVKNKAMAEDVMQEAFITAFTKIDKLEKEVTFGSWLKRIVVNKSIKLLQRENRFYSLETDVEEESINEVETENYAGIKQEQLMEAMGMLKDNYRILLSLHYIEGYDYEELVLITGFTHANCRTIISRAKDSLRKKLKTCLKTMN